VRFPRRVQLLGWALLVVAIPFLIFDPGSRPNPHVLVVGVGVGAMLGIAGGLVFRSFVPLERRLQIIRSLNPRLARHLIPAPKNDKD